MPAVDFSFSRFTVAQLKAAGVQAVCRYLTGAGKAISAAELDADLAGGICVVLAFENSATDASGGYNVGAQYAQQANAALAALGLPTSTPVYFAADTDYPNPAAAVPYYQGIASVRPGSTNGCYGEGALIDLLFSEGLVGFGWESESTSFPGSGSLSPNAALWQKVSGAPLPGTDLDLIEKADFGQLPRPTPAPQPPPQGDTSVPVSAAQEWNNQAHVLQVYGGTLYNKWQNPANGQWTSQVIAGPNGGDSGLTVSIVNATPQVAIIGNEVIVTCEDASNGHALYFVQIIGQGGWGVNELP